MKKYGIGEGVTSWYIGRLNSTSDLFLEQEALSDNDIMQLFEAMGRYIARKSKTPDGHFTVIKDVGGKETIGFKIL